MFRTLPASSRPLPTVFLGLVLTLLSLAAHLASAMADDQTWFRHPLIRRQGAPRITSFSPQSGPPGTTVTIRGSNFVGVTAVRFNGFAAQSFQIDSASQITAVVSQNATTGLITVLSPLGTGTSSDNFTVQSNTPTITSFTPTTGPPGTQVTITGTNLTGATEVSFNTTSVGTNFTVVSATQINTTVPVGATGGPIKVKTPSGEATSPQSFIVTSGAPPTISSFSPAMGPVGTVVTIEGNNFVGTTSVRFNATES
ncbi:MAG TPA: IPT/TIG domain-containing protein, partial [Acidobacteriota bacterium]|nr:IPT/TIG domain-containing protein [Acidobacteriota bacterium]